MSAISTEIAPGYDTIQTLEKVRRHSARAALWSFVASTPYLAARGSEWISQKLRLVSEFSPDFKVGVVAFTGAMLGVIGVLTYATSGRPAADPEAFMTGTDEFTDDSRSVTMMEIVSEEEILTNG